MRFEKLPYWVMPKTLPATEDMESSTCIEMTYKLYQTMNKFIESYNEFVDETNNKVNTFIEKINGDMEVWTTSIRQEFQDFIDVVDLKLSSYRNDIEQFANIIDSQNAKINELSRGYSVVYKGSVASPTSINTQDGLNGEMYLITSSFTTGGEWLEGGGVSYPANTRVMIVEDPGGQRYLTAFR